MFMVLNCTRRFLTRYVEVKSCRPQKNHIIYYHFLYELQASCECENMLWKKDGNILSESYALVNFQFFPSLDIIDKYFSIFKDFYLSQNSQLFLFLTNFLQYKDSEKNWVMYTSLIWPYASINPKFKFFLNKKFSYYHIKLHHYKFACFFQCWLFSALSQFISTAIMSKIWGKIWPKLENFFFDYMHGKCISQMPVVQTISHFFFRYNDLLYFTTFWCHYSLL